VQRIGDDQAQVSYSVARRSGSRVISSVVCIMHKETISADFFVEHQNYGRRVSLFVS
jgi:hypothetical protein